MSIVEKFNAQPWAARLGRRRENFALMAKYVSDFGPRPVIIETGCMRIHDNFEGDGQSTFIWNWLMDHVEGLHVLSIDIRPENIAVAKNVCRHVEFQESDSVAALNQGWDGIGRCALLYLDSFDWSEELNTASAFHHMMELTSVWAKLPSRCMVVVDDRKGIGRGKQWMVEIFMEHLGVKPAFKNHQIGWIKP